MTFMTALLIVMTIPMVYFVKGIRASGADGKAALPIYVSAGILPGALVSMGFLLGILGAAATIVRPSDMNYSPYLVLAGGVSRAVLSACALYSRGRASGRGAQASPGGAWILCGLASIYLAYTAVDHLAFFADKESSGILSTEISRQAGIDCDAQYLLVRREGRAFAYRCRTNLQLGSQFGQPFIPWPSYKAGSSERLLVEFEKLRAQVGNAPRTEE